MDLFASLLIEGYFQKEIIFSICEKIFPLRAVSGFDMFQILSRKLRVSKRCLPLRMVKESFWCIHSP